MNKFLIRLCLVTTLLCGILGFGMCAKAQASVSDGQKSEAQIKQSEGWLRQVAEEPQSLGGTSLRTVPLSHRVASSRLTRLLPTHGGKPMSHNGRGARGESFNSLLHPSWLACCHCRLGMPAPSPRLYYVIALRRLLC